MLAPASKRMTSFNRTCVPFRRYSFWPSRYTTRSITISLKSTSSSRLELSNVTLTLARFCRGIAGEPPQIRSSPFLERIDFIDCSPKTNRNASATFDLPEPLGPTMEAMGEVKTSSHFLPNDLNPESSMDLSARNIAFYCSKKGEPSDQWPEGFCSRYLAAIGDVKYDYPLLINEDLPRARR